MGEVLQLPGTIAEASGAALGLNLTEQEVRDACGGYMRPADQLRELHARGFTRAWITAVGRKRVILERAHYEAVTRGHYGPPPASDLAHPTDRAPLPPNRAGFRSKFGPKKKGM